MVVRLGAKEENDDARLPSTVDLKDVKTTLLNSASCVEEGWDIEGYCIAAAAPLCES